MTKPFDLSGKVVIVAGGAGRLGRPACEALVEHGGTVVVADADGDRGKALADDLGKHAAFIGVDITDESSVRHLVKTVTDKHGRIDVLVNVAYPRTENYGRRYEDVAIEDWRENVDRHLTGYYLTAREVSPVMREQSGGSIINFGSIYGVQAPDFQIYEGTDMTSPVEYAAVKGGILNLTRYLASYLGEYRIRVNAISPGGVFANQDPGFVAEYERRTPLGRMARPEDVKGPVVFLASEASAYVTGHNLLVDGGWTIR